MGEKRMRKAVVIYAKRTILKQDTPKAVLSAMGFRKLPYSRTRSCVEARLLQDIIGDATIVEKRVLYKAGNKKTLKIKLGVEKNAKFQDKLPTYSAAYKHLTGKSVEFIPSEL